MKYTIFLMLLAAFSLQLTAQTTLQEWSQKADEQYDDKKYGDAVKSYKKGFKIEAPGSSLLYNAACTAALAGKKSLAYKWLKQSIEKGWRNKSWMNEDPDFNAINSGKKWDAVNMLVDEKIAAFEAGLKYPEIRRELLAMRDEDQKWRKAIGIAKNEEEKEKAGNMIGEVDAKNTARMKEIIDEIGWPLISEVSKDGASAAWLLVQHADRQPQFQAKCLPMLKKAFKAGEASGSNYAYLFDRVAVNLGNKQRFGTQAMGIDIGTQFRPIEEEWLVSERRAEFEVNPSIEEYAKVMGFEYTIPTKEEALKKEEQQMEKYTTLSEQIEQHISHEEFDEAKEVYKKLLKLNGLTKAQDYYNFARLLVLDEEPNYKYIIHHIRRALLKDGKINREFFLDATLDKVKVQPEFDEIKALFKEME